MTDKPMSEDERAVREACEKVFYAEQDTCPPSVYIAPYFDGRWMFKSGYKKSAQEAWSAAAEFVHTRQREIARLTSAIEWLMAWGAGDDECPQSILRTLAKEKLDDLQKGMKA